MTSDVIIVGAGAAGLMAMRELSRAGLKVCMLEAGASAGGRCATIHEPGFAGPVETGAEFIHGKAEHTLRLLKEGNIHAEEVTGKMIPVVNGEWLEENEQEDYYKKFSKVVKQLGEDLTLREVLDKYFSGPADEEFRIMAEQLAKGYCLADPAKISARSLKEDWTRMDEKQYRIEGGYVSLINFLADSGNDEQAKIYTRSRVYRIVHDNRKVIAYTTDGQQYDAERIIITVPLAVLQSNRIQFEPAIAEQENAWKRLAYGSVIKMIFRFKEAFWLEKDPKASFFLSNEAIPTWWTHPAPAKTLLTGWLGGPDALEKSRLAGDVLYETALDSLSHIFQCEKESIRGQLLHHKIVCWDVHPFIRGGYSYETVEAAEAKRILSSPVKHALYFAGEALFTGAPQGTVEAALVSGLETARAIIMDM